VQEGKPDRIADILEEAANEIERLRLLYAGDMMSDKGYEESTFEKQQEFNRKRNYPL
jgi:hypothetical protein